jgi:glycosyltransferase involved in cell wall biosynthesis
VPYHSPEIEYLVPGRDGVVLANPDDADAYAEAVAGLLRDEGRRRRLVAGGRAASRRYTVEAMAERFAAGVEHALAARPLGEPPAACAAPRRL